MKTWLTKNSVEITWFLIGMLVASAVDALSSGDYIWAAVNSVLAWLNYLFRKTGF